MTTARRGVLLLAACTSATAVCLSVLAGWQRGGTLPERLVWTAIGVVLVATAHLLPAFVRQSRPVVRGVAGVLWLACMASACYGHATFFLLAQRHAGELRVAAVAPVTAVVTAGRGLTDVMGERAGVIARLAALAARRCVADCTQIESRRVALVVELDALDAEASEIRRRQVANDRIESRRDALVADPVTTRLGALLGATTASIDLLSGLTFAAVLESVACLLWSVALEPHPVDTAPPLTPAQPAAAVSRAPDSVNQPEVAASALPGLGDHQSQLARLAQDIAAGHLRATVADIRRHLGCSQSRAIALRRQLEQQDRAA
ncbi:hypothetical protein LFL96_01085 [Paraburkholderia sp. D15]|uniref:hypothetical protein n=1 Tax=Paraburkholderia sp. D15 TaxID=2880218 RepID=UPI0024791502|nr:hypothetical protein [Paraburkholderia sp. D15]WGS50136.1 hypothetical protein LFL96_01085 [Paraburkholderia sp. D15]